MPISVRTRLMSVLGSVKSSVHHHPTGGDRFQPVQTAQKGAFAGTARTDDADHFLLLDVHVDIFQYLVFTEAFVQMFDTNQSGSPLLPAGIKSPLQVEDDPGQQISQHQIHESGGGVRSQPLPGAFAVVIAA